MAILKEGNYSGMARSSTFRGYIRGMGPEADWPQVIEDVKGVIGRADIKLKDSDSWVAQTVAIEWAKQDLENSLEWYIRDPERDLSNPKDTTQISSVLGSLPLDEKYLAVNWIDSQRDQPDWNDQLVMSYGRVLASRTMPLDGDVERLAGFISSEDDRFEFVSKFIHPWKTGVEPSIRYPREALNKLVVGANLSVERTAGLQKVIASSKSE